MKRWLTKWMARTLSVCLCIGMLGGAASADPDTLECWFYGWVTDAGMRPVEKVRITLETPEPEMLPIENVYAETDANGYWELLIPKAEYRFLFTHAGYQQEVRVWKYDGELDDRVECEPVMLLVPPPPPTVPPAEEIIGPLVEATVDPADILQGQPTAPPVGQPGQEGTADPAFDIIPPQEGEAGPNDALPTDGMPPVGETAPPEAGAPPQEGVDPLATEPPAETNPPEVLPAPTEPPQETEPPAETLPIPEETIDPAAILQTPLPEETPPPESIPPEEATTAPAETPDAASTPTAAPNFAFIPSTESTPMPFGDAQGSETDTAQPETHTNVPEPAAGQEVQGLSMPVFSEADTVMTQDNAELRWQAVDRAAYYQLTITSVTDAGAAPILHGERVDDTSAALPQEALIAGHSYLATVTAVAEAGEGAIVESEPAYWVFDYVGQTDADGTPGGETAGTVSTILSNLDTFANGAGTPVITDIGHVLNAGQINFAWGAVTGATQYTFTMARGPVLAVDHANTGASTAYQTAALGIGCYVVTVDAFNGETHMGTSAPYVFYVIDPAYTGHAVWAARDAVPVYANDNDPTPLAVTLAHNQEALAVGLNQAGTFYQIQLSTGEYGFVSRADVTLVTPMTAPYPPTITYTEDDPYLNVSITAVDPRPAVYQIAVYVGTPETLVYVDTVSTLPYRMRLTLYDTPCRVEVIAKAADATQNIPDSVPVSTTFTRSSPTNAAQMPVYTGDVAAGFLMIGSSSAQWNAIAGASGYEWKVMDSRDGQVKANGVAIESTVPAASLAGLTANVQYVFAVRTIATNMNPSPWVIREVMVIASSTPFITGFTMSANQVTPGTTVTFQLLGQTLPAATKVVIVYNNTTMEYDVNITTNKTVSLRFDQLGSYAIHFTNGTALPPTASQTLLVANQPITLTIKEIGVKEKDKTFNIEWNAVSDTTFSLLIWHMDGTLQFPASSIKTNSYAVPATSVPKIGPYSVTVTAEVSEPKPTATATFNVIDASYKSTTGKVKEAATPMYLYAGNKTMVTQLSKDQSVTVLGELDGYYHIRLGTTTGTTTTSTTTTTETTTYGFVLKDALTVTASSSSGGSSGGSSSGGSGGSRTGSSSSINAAAFKAAFETEEIRRASYAYIPKLYLPLMEMMADPENTDVMPRTLQELLTINFAPLPQVLNSEQYAEPRERAAWNQVTAYLIMLVSEAATDEVVQQPDAMQALATYAYEVIDEQLLIIQTATEEAAEEVQLIDDAVQKVLGEVSAQAKTVAESKSAGALQGTNQEIAISVIERILNTMPYDAVLLEEIPKAFDTTLHPDIVPDEPLEVRLLRVLYALSDYEQTRFALALEALGDTASIDEINTVYNAYLDYVYAVARMHNLGFTMGKASANEVVQNWGTETKRLVNVNEVYNTFPK